MDNHVTDSVQQLATYIQCCLRAMGVLSLAGPARLGGAMALVSICVLPNHAIFMTDTLDATFVTSILFVCANSNVCPGSTMHFMYLSSVA